MQYNGKGTVYFRHARAIKDASERIFEDFKVSGIVLEMDEINIRSKNGGNGRSCEKQDPSLNTGSPSDVRLEDESSGYVFNGKRFQAIDENRRSTYNPTCALVQGNDSLLTTIIGESSHVIPMGYQMEFLYAKSLARFAADLGPLVWKVAAEKIKKALPPGCPFGPGWVGEKEAIGVTSALLNKQRLGVQPIKQFEKLSSESKVAGTSDTQVHPMTQSNPDDGSRNREEDGSVASALSSKQCLAVQLTQQSEKLSTEKEVTGVLNVKGIPVSQSKFNDRSQIREGDVLLNTGVYLMVQSKPARSDQQIHPVMQSKLENTNCSMEKDMDTLDVGVIPATQSEQGSKEETCRVSKLLDCEAGVCGVAELPIEARSSVAFGNSLIQNANLEKLDQEAPAKFGAHAELISRFHGLDNSSRSHGHSSLQCGDTKLPVKNDQSSKVVNSMLKLAEQVNLNNPVSLQPEEEATLESGISKHIDRDVHVNTQLPVFRTTNAINVINDKGFHMEESGHLRRSFDSRIAQPDTGVNQLRTELGKMLMNNPLNSKVGQLKVNLGELPTSDIASSFRPPQSVKGANQVTKIGEIRSNTATRDHFDGQNSAYHSNWQSRLNGIQSAEPGTVQTSNSINDNIYQPKNFQNPRGLGFPHNLNLPEQHELDASDVVINNTGSIPSDQTKSASSLSHSAQGFNLLRNAGLKTGESGVENQDGGGPLHPILSASSVSHAAQELGMQNNAITTQHTSINSQHSSSNRVSSCNVNLAEVGLSALPSPLFLESSIRERVKETCNYRQNELVNLPTRMATGDVTSIMQKGFTSDIDFLMQPMEPRNGQLIDRDLANIAVQNVGQLSKKQFTSQGLPLANFPSGLSSMNNMPVVQDVPGWVQVQAEPMHISGKGSKDKFHHEVLDKPFNFSETSSNSAIRIPLHASRCQDPQVYDYGDKKQGLNMPHFLQSHQYGDSIQSPSGQCHQRQQLHTQSPRPLAQQNVWSTPLLLNAQTSGPPAAEGLNFSRQYQSPNQSMLSQGGVLPWQYLPQQMQHQGSRQCPAGPDLNVSLPPSKSSYDQSNSNEIQQPDLALQL
ncbi:hypothetical protein KP509_29G070400 [Ceratopteris richardii]|nr:hypothetical protein KP509_29G070400 [Ceratopteris richardii]